MSNPRQHAQHSPPAAVAATTTVRRDRALLSEAANPTQDAVLYPGSVGMIGSAFDNVLWAVAGVKNRRCDRSHNRPIGVMSNVFLLDFAQGGGTLLLSWRRQIQIHLLPKRLPSNASPRTSLMRWGMESTRFRRHGSTVNILSTIDPRPPPSRPPSNYAPG